MAVGDGAVRSGEVWLDDYDRAIKEHVGGVERAVPGSGGPTPWYVLDWPDIRGDDAFGGSIPVTFGDAQDVLTPFVLPCVVIVRDDDVDIDTTRMTGWSRAYRVPTAAAIAAGVITVETGLQGYNEYEHRECPKPVVIRYTIWGRARTSREASKMFRRLYKRMEKWGTLSVRDSENVLRGYSIEVEGMSRTTETDEVLNRRPSCSFRVAIQGELEHDEPVKSKAVTSMVLTTTAKE